jgi:hypothetical protein
MDFRSGLSIAAGSAGNYDLRGASQQLVLCGWEGLGLPVGLLLNNLKRAPQTGTNSVVCRRDMCPRRSAWKTSRQVPSARRQPSRPVAEWVLCCVVFGIPECNSVVFGGRFEFRSADDVFGKKMNLE